MRISGRQWLRPLGGIYSFTFLAAIAALSSVLGVGWRQQALGGVTELKSHLAEQRGRLISPGYVDAFASYLSVRAYPDDLVDWEALRRGIAHRDAMPSGPKPMLKLWEYVGPQAETPPEQTAFGLGAISGRVNGVAFDPTISGRIYAASAAGGLWRSNDSGSTWAALTDTWSDLSTSCVVVDPRDSNCIYVGTGDLDGMGGYGQGVMRSTDGGLTWYAWGPAEAQSYAVRRILVDPDDSDVVTLITGRGAGQLGKVWRTDDAGDTWTAVITTSASWDDLVCGAENTLGVRYYYVSAGGTNAQVWRSSDRGATWVQLSAPMRSGVSSLDTSELAVSPTNPDAVYLLGTGDHKVWRSTNDGANWTNITGSVLAAGDWTQGSYDFSITCTRFGSYDALYVGLTDVFQSLDGGATWTSFAESGTGDDLTHANQHAIEVDPANALHLLLANDGGVYSFSITGSSTGSFASLNAGLGVAQVYSADGDPANSNNLIAGMLNNGSAASLGSLTGWTGLTPGSGVGVAINQQYPYEQYTVYPYYGASASGGTIGFNRTADSWADYSYSSTSAGSVRIAWGGPLAMSKNLGGTLFFGTNYLYKYEEFLPGWTSRVGNQALSSSSTITSIAAAQSDTTVLYTGSGDGQLWMSRNNGSAWTQINTGTLSLPNRAYTALRVQPAGSNDVLVGLSGSGVHHLWRCSDTFSSGRTWIDVSGTGPSALPDTPINSIEVSPADPLKTWYVGTDIGVFRTTDAGSTWMNCTSPYGLPNIEVTQLFTRNGYLYAATFGRGLWRLNLGTALNLSILSLSVSPTEVIATANSTGTVTLNSVAPSGGVDVALTSSNTAAATTPATVHVDAGETTGTFTITTHAVDVTSEVTITGSYGGNTASAVLTVDTNGLALLTLNPTTVIGGVSSTGTVMLGTPSQNSGTTVNLSSSNTAVATVPSTVVIPAGQRSATFTITTIPTAFDSSSTISASAGGATRTAVLTIRAPALKTLTLNPSTVLGGNPSTGTITLTGAAPAAGATISLTSSNPSAASVPSAVTVSGFATTTTFAVSTHIVSVDTPVTITAQYGSLHLTATLTVLTQKVATLVLSPNPVIGGNNVTGTLTLAGPAQNAITVTLASDNTALVTVPPSVTIPAGSSSASFTATTRSVDNETSVDISATAAGSTQFVALTLQPMKLIGFTVTPATTYAGGSVTGTVTLNGPALSGGATVVIGNSNPAAATAPSTVTVPQGAVSKSFTVTAKAVSAGAATTLTASRNGILISQILTVVPVGLGSLDLERYSAIGGATVRGVVRIPVAAPSGGYRVALTSSEPSVATLPASVTIAAGATAATFTVTTKPVPGTVFVTITASNGTSSLDRQLQVLPPEVQSFKLSTSQIRGGNTVSGTVTLTGKAPTGGVAIYVNADPNLATPATAVLVRAGANSVTFKIVTRSVSVRTSVTLSARSFSVTKVVTLTLTP